MFEKSITGVTQIEYAILNKSGERVAARVGKQVLKLFGYTRGEWTKRYWKICVEFRGEK